MEEPILLRQVRAIGQFDGDVAGANGLQSCPDELHRLLSQETIMDSLFKIGVSCCVNGHSGAFAFVEIMDQLDSSSVAKYS